MDGGVTILGTAVSELQSGVTVSGNNVSGTLAYKEGYTGFSSDPSLQEGNYLALQWAAPAAGITSVRVGLDPSAIGMDLVETINDPDHNGVFRVTNTSQKFKIVQSNGTHTRTQVLDLSGLTLESKVEG